MNLFHDPWGVWAGVTVVVVSQSYSSTRKGEAGQAMYICIEKEIR